MEANQHLRAIRRASTRGLTLVEIIITITIIGMVTAAIAVGVLKAKGHADVGVAKAACNTIRSTTTQWKAVHPGEDCPTMDQLKTEELDRGFSVKDPWGVPYRLSCESGDVTCTSNGPDKKEGTDDDIIVPAPEGK